MKKIFVYIFLLGIAFTSCDREEVSPENCEDTMVCEDDCQFVLANQIGRIAFVNCYDTWGVYYRANPDIKYETLALVVDLPEDCRVEEKAVIFSASFFENDIPFLFPDPPGPAAYKIELCDISTQN